MLRLLRIVVSVASLAAVTVEQARGAEQVLEPKLRHLRNAEPREWSEFPERAEATELRLPFEVANEFRPQTLVLRHRDLRRDWIIYLDGRELIRLPQGDQDATTFWPVSPDKFSPGKHELRIATKDKAADDVMIGELQLDTRTKAEMLGEATVEVEVRDATKSGRGPVPVPCRLTLVDERGSLMTVGVEPKPRLAIRPGVIYTLDGRAQFTVPAGTYILYASRGSEYSVVETRLELKPGDVAKHRLTLDHEVEPFPECSVDTHVHTLTHSGHGDCTIEERIVTLAGEGLLLAYATDHNKTIDYTPTIAKLNTNDQETGVVIGNEVTTKVGHFNVLDLKLDAPPIDHEGKTWAEIGAAIKKAGPKGLVILNHARDIHNGFRPFGPERHISVAGEDVAGWKLPANAMEVFNSGSTQNDPTQLFHDWLGLLNRGLNISPIGSSDSHDVSRYIVGQGRTYFTFDTGLTDGRSRLARPVAASLGLLCRISNDEGRFDPQSPFVPHATEYVIDVSVNGPSWIRADEVRLYVNGRETTENPIEDHRSSHGPLRYNLKWKLTNIKHDIHVVALAKGPGVDKPYWPIAKPYQPTSPDWKSYVIGCSGAIKIDGDGDGKYSSPFDYAKQLVAEVGTDDAKLVARLAEFDEAVAVQTTSVLRAAGPERWEAFLAAVTKEGAPQVKSGARKYVAGWRSTLTRGDEKK
ncbi:MAG: CehA/McbA family metallohydrolase [Planctomycetia bacterium]|nr:CehA/McbA family metallohydrolase [Planctomycetia bacterium]